MEENVIIKEDEQDLVNEFRSFFESKKKELNLLFYLKAKRLHV